MYVYSYSAQVVSVTYVKAGNALDATPAIVEFGGTLRSITTEGLYRLQKRVKEVSKIMHHARLNLLELFYRNIAVF